MLAEMALRREKVAERLLELREAHGLSQEVAAQKVGITHRQWQRWESGTSTPYPRSLDAVASKFGITVAEFFDEDIVPTPSRDQLDRIEGKLDDILAKLDQVAPASKKDLKLAAETLEQGLGEAGRDVRQGREASARKKPAPGRRKRVAGGGGA